MQLPSPEALLRGRVVGAAEGIYNRQKEAPGRTMTDINVTELAATKITEILAEESKQESGLRVFVQGGGCSGFQYGLMIEEAPGAGDRVIESNGIRLFVDPISIRYLKGAQVDFVDSISGGGFTIKNPNARSTCGCGQSFTTEDTGN